VPIGACRPPPGDKSCAYGPGLTRCGLGTYENVVFLFVLIYDQND